MPYDFEQLVAALREQGTAFAVHEHPPVLTVDEMMRVCADIEGVHTKNLFLRDSKKTYFLVTLPHDARTDLKALRPVLGAKGSLSFASADALGEQLHVISGAVSPLAALNGAPGTLKVFVEASLLATEVINIHPLTNDRTLSVRGRDLAVFMAAHGHVLHGFALPSADVPPAS